jgi:ribosomal protein S18 acetylase RimI-like enzyme
LATVTIVQATVDDARAIAEVHVHSWQQAYRGLLPDEYLALLSIDQREQFWVDVLTNRQSEVMLAIVKGTVTGFISYAASRDNAAKTRKAEILALYIDPVYSHKGIGKALWQSCRDKLNSDGYQSVALWVVIGNTRASEFYEAQGFRQESGIVEPFEMAGVSLLETRYVYDL